MRVAGMLLVALLVAVAVEAAPRQREPNASYAERRAKLRAQIDAPLVLFGYTGRENTSPSYIFSQEHNFYYLTGHNQEGAALLLIPDKVPATGAWEGPREILFMPARNRQRERWDGLRIGPADANAGERTGFDVIRASDALKPELEKAARLWGEIYTLTPPGRGTEAGYPHTTNWSNWLRENAPGVELKDARRTIAGMRQIKMASEMELLTKAIELSMDAHLEAMRMMQPGLWEYEVAARMEYIYKRGGCDRAGYSPIVGSGFFSTVLHYNTLERRIEAGDVIVLDVGGEYAGYTADITRTLPATGKFTARQREIYEVVLAAQNAAMAAIKPGVTMAELTRITRETMDKAAAKDKDGNPLGRYFIHGLGHHIGLNVHDASDGSALTPGMVLTIEPGIYIPEENLGVRIEDIVLITADGYKLLTARLPRTVEDVERTMAEAARSRR